jgi:hypothetical protein
MTTVGIYTIEISESENVRTISEGVTKNLFNISITNNETGETIEMDDIVSPYEREAWCASVFNKAKEGLDSVDGPSCCYVNARYAS